MVTKLFSNIVYILWAGVYILITYYILGATNVSLMFAVGLYAISITIALSPIGEVILRFMENARKPNEREKEYLLPIFEEVYENAKNEYPKLSKHIKIYIIDKGFVNAFAMGRNSIAVTGLAINTFSPEELKGILGHELGHIAHGHTKALLLTLVGNAIFSLAIIFLRFILWCIDIVMIVTKNTGAIIVLTIIHFLFDIAFILFTFFGNILLAINSRSNEYQADKFSYTIGYGEELTEALYSLQTLHIPTKISLRDRLTSSHPHIASRISRLETYNKTEVA